VSVSESYVTYVTEQLTGVGRLRSKRMFGGVGFYSDDLFFGLLAGDALYLKVDDITRGDFTARGMGPFMPFPDKPDYAMGYYEVPADVIEDAEALVAWARKAMRVAAAAPRNTKLRKARSLGADAPEPGSGKAKAPKKARRNTR
jgi:DNA transformation protein and related proteins